MKKLQITRSSPDYDELVELYKKEKQAKLKVRYHALVLMRELQDCKMVAELVKKSQRTLQLWVNAFNESGLEAIMPNILLGDRPALQMSRKKN